MLQNNFNRFTNIAKKMEELKQNRSRGITFNMGLSMFEETISGNFRAVHSMFCQQRVEIDRLSAALEAFKEEMALLNKSNMKDEVKNAVQNSKNHIFVGDYEKLNEQSGENITQEERKQGSKTIEKASIDLQQSKKLLSQFKDNPTDISSMSIQKQQTMAASTSLTSLMEDKIFQLFERVRKIEQKQSHTERSQLKKFRQFDFQLQQSQQKLQKNKKLQDQFNDTVQQLRNQLMQFKLKKESKILKVFNSTSLNKTSSGTGDNYDYIAEKVQFLTKHVNEMLTKRNFEEEKELIHQSIDNLRRKLNDSVSQSFFDQSLKALQSRIYQSVSKYIKALNITTEKKDEGESELDAIIEQGNREFSQRVNEHQQKIKQANEDIMLLKAQLELNRRQRLQFQDDSSQLIRQAQEKAQGHSLQLQDLHKLIQDMKQITDQKLLQSQNQIIELQQIYEKMNSNFKTFAYSTKEGVNRIAVTPTPSKLYDNPELSSMHEKQASNDIENEMRNIQKKMNKLMGKVQGIKEDVLNYREDSMRDIQGVKAGIQKKADWQSLKKGLNYFQEKLKETKALVQAIYESSPREDGDSLAVKKGWTCLVCDKDIKNYQGKLGQLKFTSMFPVRESPRIGGYYKQQQASQQYRQVYLSNSNLNNRSRRIGSLKGKQSKQEIS